MAYGLAPGQPQDLLLTPRADTTPGVLARELRERVRQERETEGFETRDERWPSDPQIAYNQTSVVARLHFHEMIRVALPLSVWWRSYLLSGEAANITARYLDESQREDLAGTLASTLGEKNYPVVWITRVVGTIASLNLRAAETDDLEAEAGERTEIDLAALKSLLDDPQRTVRATFDLIGGMNSPDPSEEPCLWVINRNRPSEVALLKSAATVKAEATRRLFQVRGKGISWAVLDSGIDARHPAFRKRIASDDGDSFADEPFTKKTLGKGWVNNTRVSATYDFTKIRRLLSADPSLEGVPQELLDRASRLGLKSDLKKALKFGRDIDWELFDKLLRMEHSPQEYKPPEHHHGTHVAGIIGADWPAERERHYLGICPEIELYDLRVLDEDGRGDEFSIMAALQFIRYLNTRRNLVRDLMEVHGANVSFSLKHDVSNYGCGRTPVCEECERLVASGVVVVAAAGNRGRARYMTTDGAVDEGYRPISITDPGNADSVITVGATHRQDPHTFGVSYFSSRGPTGDGRQKPDLLAPGEKITSTIPGEDSAVLDGTSMAAPHVSGAAALLMERHSELRGRPDMVKRVLCDTATDLGRTREFQGFGLVDTLRALQSI
jgi:subtilisin family serine protease